MTKINKSAIEINELMTGGEDIEDIVEDITENLTKAIQENKELAQRR